MAFEQKIPCLSNLKLWKRFNQIFGGGDTFRIFHNYDKAKVIHYKAEKKGDNRTKLLKYTFYFSFLKRKCSSSKTSTYLTFNEFKRTGGETAPQSIYGKPNVWS